MFSGIGGFEYGMDQSDIEFECVGFAEVDKYAESIYSRHFPEHRNFGDVRKIRTEELPDFEFLVGGFPCQSFSNAGKKRGFDDTRGTLFFEIARVLKDKRPKYFLLENVKGLLYNNDRKTFKRILEVLANLGYYVKWEIFNSKDFGVPQSRERVFIKGYFRKECGREVLFNQGGYTQNNKIISNTYYNNKTERIHYPDEQTITKPIKICENTKKGYKEAHPFDGVIINRYGSRLARGMVQSNKVGTLDTYSSWGVVTDDYNIRRLTPVECERLQGFPDNYTKYGADDELISDTQRYKCIGNAVTTNVITAIVNEMFRENIKR